MVINREILTLEEFRNRELRELPHATGELSSLLRDISLAGKRIHNEVNRAGLADIIGSTGQLNIHSEEVKKMDVFAHQQLVGALRRGVSCAGVVSEELPDLLGFDEPLSNQSKYVCAIDPLDGSSNIDVNISIGTIFGIYRRVTEKNTPCTAKDFLQAGIHQVAAGYIIYGSSTMLVYATRRGVNGFTLDSAMGEFTLSHPDIKVPPHGSIYSVNNGHFFLYSKKVQQYITSCQQGIPGRVCTQRYTGSLVADLHRNLIKGGIFLYPALNGNPDGKLRLLYECNPFAFITEVAGGLATDGKQRILEIQPANIHERTPFFAGSKYMMEELHSFL